MPLAPFMYCKNILRPMRSITEYFLRIVVDIAGVCPGPNYPGQLSKKRNCRPVKLLSHFFYSESSKAITKNWIGLLDSGVVFHKTFTDHFTNFIISFQ